jgi:hypothetical protein
MSALDGAVGGWPEMVRKILTWLFVGFLIYFVAKRPAAASIVAKWIAALLAAIATGLSEFVSRMVGA